jgi:PKD repeat protein
MLHNTALLMFIKVFMLNYSAHFKTVFCGCLVLLSNTGVAQCPVNNFTADAAACRNEAVVITNTSSNATDYYWDFCADDMGASPTLNQLTTSGAIASPYGYKTVTDNGKWYGFIVDRATRKIFRADFGTNLENPDPTYVEVTGAGLLFTSSTPPEDIDLLKVGSNWFAVVARDGFGTVVLLDFGTNIENTTPLFTELGNFGIGSKVRGVELNYDAPNARIIMLLTTTTRFLTIVDLGNSFYNAGTTSVIDVIGAGSIFSAVDLVQTCSNWFLFAATFGNNSIHRIAFGTNIMSAPSSIITYSLGANNEPWDLDIIREGEETYLLVSDLSTTYQLMDFGKVELNETPTIVATGNPSATRFTGASVVPYNGKYLMHGMNLSQAKLNRVTFARDCGASQQVSTAFSPSSPRYTIAGIHKILLRASNSQYSKEITQTTTVAALDAPDISIDNTNICVGNATLFSPVNASGNITNYAWNFGDGVGSSASVNPSYTYSAIGEYSVLLTVQASNGCGNAAMRTIEIYNEPVASFDLPVGLICTNNLFTFTNTTVDAFDGNLTYQWLVDSQPVGTARNLQFSFTTGGMKSVVLQASIPGCSDQATQSIANVGEGPLVDFTIVGKCLNETISFTNASSGAIASYTWNFGDGQNSAAVSPTHSYVTASVYPVQLAATGTNGCVSTKIENHQIFAAPQPNFFIDLPPFSCSGTPTQFNDLTPTLTDSNLADWLWTFDDNSATSASTNPQHTYAVSNNYNVMLQVTSDQNCSAQIVKNVFISPSPTPVITNSAACLGNGATFSDGSGAAAMEWIWQIEDNFYFTATPSHLFSESGNYLASLTITATNGCIGTATKNIAVPNAPGLDFVSSKKCVDNEAIFLALITPSDDAVVDYTWQFGADQTTGSTTEYIFNSTGSKDVELTVTTVSECEYSITKAVTVVPAPIANFSFTPESGKPPLVVQFTNQSLNATAYAWAFNDAANSTSVVISPLFTYTQLGNYAVDLKATNAEGCENIFTKLVKVVLPQVQLYLSDLRVEENADGSWQTFVTLNNTGNTSLQNVNVNVTLSNGTQFREVVANISDEQALLYEFNTRVVPSPAIQFICVSVSIPENSATENLNLCQSLESATVLTSPYPNPADSELIIEWVSIAEESVQITMLNQLGEEVFVRSISSISGLNRQIVTISGIASGVYFVRLSSATAEKTFRTIISR